jgi:hypothetical protein
VQPVDVESEPEGRVADNLVEVAHGEIVVADVTYGGARRGVDVETGVFAEFANAEEMGCVGDDDDVVKIVFVGDGGEAVDLLLGVDGAGLGDDAAEGDSIGEEIVAADASFGVAGVLIAASPEGDDHRSDLFAIEIDGMVEAGVKDRGWVAGVLGCTEDGDGVGGLSVVMAGNCGDLLIDPDTPGSGDQQDQPEQPAKEETAGSASASQIGGRGDHRIGRTNLYGKQMRAHIYGYGRVSAKGSIVRRASVQVGLNRSNRSTKKLELTGSRDLLMLECEGDLVSRDRAFAENHPGVAASGEVDDGGGGGAGGRAAVDDEGQLVAELLADADGGGALGQAEEVGRGGCNGQAEAGDDGAGDGGFGDAQGEIAGVGGDAEGKTRAGLDDDGEGARPELFCEAIEGGVELAGELVGLGDLGDEQREGLVAGAGFELVDAVDGGEIDRVDGEAVEGVGGQGDDVAAVEAVGYIANERWLGIVGMDADGFGRQNSGS